MKTDEELKQLAMDIYDGKVFTDRHIATSDYDRMMPSIFMPIALGAFSEMPDEELKNITLVYEYLGDSNRMSVNGYPTFFSFRFLTRNEHAIMNKYFTEYSEMKTKFIGATL